MKKLLTLFYILCMGIILTMPAFAYVDPGVTSMAIQAVAGVVIAAGAVIGVLWSKAKKKAAKVLNIDENAGKVVEEDIVVDEQESLDPVSAAEVVVEEEAVEEEAAEEEPAEEEPAEEEAAEEEAAEEEAAE